MKALAVYRGKTVMMDCGVHPGYAGLRSLPYLDSVDLSTVDLMLITHFHLDHCAAVPYVTSHTNFKVSTSSSAMAFEAHGVPLGRWI